MPKSKDQQLKQKIAEIIIKHLGVCDKESPEEILRLFEEEVLQIKKEVVKKILSLLKKEELNAGNFREVDIYNDIIEDLTNKIKKLEV